MIKRKILLIGPNTPTECPHCQVSLLADKVPEKYKEHVKGDYYKREIWVNDIYDDTNSHYFCPDCKGAWTIAGNWLIPKELDKEYYAHFKAKKK